MSSLICRVCVDREFYARSINFSRLRLDRLTDTDIQSVVHLIRISNSEQEWSGLSHNNVEDVIPIKILPQLSISLYLNYSLALNLELMSS